MQYPTDIGAKLLAMHEFERTPSPTKESSNKPPWSHGPLNDSPDLDHTSYPYENFDSRVYTNLCAQYMRICTRAHAVVHPYVCICDADVNKAKTDSEIYIDNQGSSTAA